MQGPLPTVLHRLGRSARGVCMPCAAARRCYLPTDTPGALVAPPVLVVPPVVVDGVAAVPPPVVAPPAVVLVGVAAAVPVKDHCMYKFCRHIVMMYHKKPPCTKLCIRFQHQIETSHESQVRAFGRLRPACQRTPGQARSIHDLMSPSRFASVRRTWCRGRPGAASRRRRSAASGGRRGVLARRRRGVAGGRGCCSLDGQG